MPGMALDVLLRRAPCPQEAQLGAQTEDAGLRSCTGRCGSSKGGSCPRRARRGAGGERGQCLATAPGSHVCALVQTGVSNRFY